jgi:hypothetical protein
MSQVQILAQRLAVFTKVFHGFLQFLEANAGMVPVPLVMLWSLHFHILSNSLFTNHPINWHYIIWATDSVIKQTINENTLSSITVPSQKLMPLLYFNCLKKWASFPHRTRYMDKYYLHRIYITQNSVGNGNVCQVNSLQDG